jgi:hypothetical protein
LIRGTARFWLATRRFGLRSAYCPGFRVRLCRLDAQAARPCVWVLASNKSGAWLSAV